MAVCGRETEAFLRPLLTLDHGLPSHDAVSDRFTSIDPKGLQTAVLQLVGGWQDDGGDDVMALDGTV